LRWAKVGWTFVAVAIIFFLVRSLLANWSRLDLSFDQIQWGWLAASAALFVASYAVSSWLWHECLAVFEASPGYWVCFETIALAQLAKYLPGGVWAVVGQVELSRRAGVRRATALVAVGLMSAAVILTGLVFGVIAGAPVLALGTARVVAVLVGVVLLAVAMQPAVFTRLVRLTFRAVGREAPPMSLTWLDITRVVAVALAYWPVVGMGFYLMAGAFVRVDAAYALPFAAAYAVSFTIGYVAIFAPGGLGVRETVMVFFLARVVGFAGATLVALGQRVWFTVMELLVAGGWLLARRLRGHHT